MMANVIPPAARGVALVTGAARGLGQGFAVRLANDGYHVVAVDKIDCQETLDLIAQRGGAGSQALVDLSNAQSIVDGVEVIMSRVGMVDVLVNNAGIIPNVAFEKIDYGVWRSLMSINLDAPFLLCRAVIPAMKAKQRGRIINIASNTVGLKIPGFVHYVTSKAGLIGMTRSLAREVGDYGICVNAIAPGLVEHEGQNAPKALTELQLKARSIKRLQTPDDLMGTLVFLSSSDSDFMTGQAIVVDGGSIFH